MAQYHINPKTGQAGKCSAKIECPFGSSEDSHYESLAQARSVYELKQGSSFEASPPMGTSSNPYDGMPYGADIKDFEITALQESAYHYGNYNDSDAKAMRPLASMAKAFSSPTRLDRMVSYAGQHLNPKELEKNTIVLQACLENPATRSATREELAVRLLNKYDGLQPADLAARAQIAGTLAKDPNVSGKTRKKLAKTFGDYTETS